MERKNNRKRVKPQEPACDFCHGYGYIEICAGIGPRVKCPDCIKKEERR
jgi:hypothetical protein